MSAAPIFDPEKHDGIKVLLRPNANNPIHKQPVTAFYQSGYFYCEGSNPADGPDYYLGDVSAYNDSIEVLP